MTEKVKPAFLSCSSTIIPLDDFDKTKTTNKIGGGELIKPCNKEATLAFSPKTYCIANVSPP